MKRKICVVTGSRAEYGPSKNILKAIDTSNVLELNLVVTGTHLSKKFGYTVDEIERDGFKIKERVEINLAADNEIGVGKAIGSALISMVDCLRKITPDIVLITGDRYEIFAVAVAAMSLNIPIAHVSGGELTEGSNDEQMRHAITKMSHIHFVASEDNANRVMQMGEEPWRVFTVGGPWVDNYKALEQIDKEDLKKRLGINFDYPTLLVTYHSVTLQVEQTKYYIQTLIEALNETEGEIIFTYPNADEGGLIIIEQIKQFAEKNPRAKVFKSLGLKLYLNVLAHVDAVVGNSSSGMVESQVFKKPVVNIGIRQKGRLVTENIICVSEEKSEISKAIKWALSNEFRKNIKHMVNPYDSGDVAKNIIEVLTTVVLGPKMMIKKFNEIE